MTTKHSEECFLKWLLNFDWLLRSKRLFDSHFLLVYFSGLKYILAFKMRHNARQSDNNTLFLRGGYPNKAP